MLTEDATKAGSSYAHVKFTVIVTTYNYAHLLPDALRSIAAQTVSDFEVLVVDDGSTDNTEEVVNHFRPLFRSFRYLKKPHTGPADTRNVAIQAAKGSHIAFLDADDLWSSHYLETVQGVFNTNPEAKLFLCEGIRFWSDRGIVTEAELEKELPAVCGPAHSPQDLFAILRAVSPSGMVFSKTLYDRVGPYDAQSFGSLVDDIDWTLRALIAGTFCICLKQKLYLYRRHASNLTNNASDSFQGWLTIYSQTLEASRASPQIEALARGVIRWHSVRFLPTCSKREGQLLLRRAIEVLGGDPYIRLCYIGTYLGLVGLLKLFKRLKALSHGLFQKKLAIDLSTSSEAVFNGLPR